MAKSKSKSTKPTPEAASDDNRGDVIFVRVNDEEKKAIESRAAKLGLKTGPFARMLLLKGALPVEG